MRVTRRVRITRRVKFYGCGYWYGWTLPVGYVPVAILSREGPPRENHCQNFFLEKGWILLIKNFYNQPFNWAPLNKQKIIEKSSVGVPRDFCRRRPSLLLQPSSPTPPAVKKI
jgi:hypothetical protein